MYTTGKKSTEDRTVKEEVVMGRRWLSVGGISAPEEPQYWMRNNVETCSTPTKIGCVFVSSPIPVSLPRGGRTSSCALRYLMM